MVIRPRDANPLGTGGIVRLGSSFLNPVLSEFVDNGTPGFPADSFITVDNRLSQPIQVTPAFQDSSPDYTQYYTVPPLTRSTVAIDPQRGVLLTCSSRIRTQDTNSGNLVTRTYERRTVSYRLHSNGAAPSEPLYPLDRCICSVVDALITTTTVQTFFCGNVFFSSGTNVVVATGIDSMCIVAVTAVLFSGVQPANGLLQLNAFYDSTNPTQVSGGWPIFVAGDPAGTSVTIAVDGATALQVGNSNLSAVSQSIALLFWLGVPGN